MDMPETAITAQWCPGEPLNVATAFSVTVGTIRLVCHIRGAEGQGSDGRSRFNPFPSGGSLHGRLPPHFAQLGGQPFPLRYIPAQAHPGTPPSPNRQSVSFTSVSSQPVSSSISIRVPVMRAAPSAISYPRGRKHHPWWRSRARMKIGNWAKSGTMFGFSPALS